MKKSFLRNFTFSVNRPGGGGLTLLLLLVVVVPSFCLIWFMNKAVGNERLAMQQKLLDLYQVPLTVNAHCMDDGWQGKSRDFDEFFSRDWPAALSAGMSW